MIFAFSLISRLTVSFILQVFIIWIFLSRIIWIIMVWRLTFLFVFLAMRQRWFLWFLMDCNYLIYIIKIYYLVSFLCNKNLLRSNAFRRKCHYIWMNFTLAFIDFIFPWISVFNFVAFALYLRNKWIFTFTFAFWLFNIATYNWRHGDTWWEWINIALECRW